MREGITRMGLPSRSDPFIVRASRTAFSVSNATNATNATRVFLGTPSVLEDERGSAETRHSRTAPHEKK